MLCRVLRPRTSNKLWDLQPRSPFPASFSVSAVCGEQNCNKAEGITPKSRNRYRGLYQSVRQYRPDTE